MINPSLIDYCEQGSDEWLLSRVITASNFGKILTPTGKKSTQSKDYMSKILGQWMTGVSPDSFKSGSMDRGTELEEEAKNYYEFENNCDVETVGLIYKNDKKLISCSPDGLSDERKKGLEIKCPEQNTQIEILLSGEMPLKYIPQVQGAMWVTGLTEWDFLSYHPDMPKLLITVKKDEAYHKLLDTFIYAFLAEMLEKREILNKL